MSLYTKHKRITYLGCIVPKKEDIIVVDESCELVGTLEVSVPSHVEGIWEAHERYVFGMTEIEVSARVEATNQTFEITFNNNILEEKFAV